MTKVNNYVEFLNNPNVNRILVVGDIHGQYDLLMKALKKLNFDPETELLICVGDLVNRGDGNLEAVALLDTPWFYSVRGNHDQMCIEGLSNTKMKQAHKAESGEWFYELSDKQQEKIFNKFSELPFLLEVKYRGFKFGVVHGDIHVNDWEQFKSLFNQQDNDWIERLQNNIIWGRTRIEHQDSKAFTAVANVDYVFLGHTIVKKPTALKNCHYIDTGAYNTGDFSFAIFDQDGMSIQTIKGKKP